MTGHSSKIRLYNLAKELKLNIKKLIEEVRRQGVDVSIPSNSISQELADRIRDKYVLKRSQKNPVKKLPENSLHLYTPIANHIQQSTPTSQLSVIHFTGPLPPDRRLAAKAITAKRSTARQDHLALTKPAKEAVKQTNECPTCGAPFKFKTEMKSHLFKAHGFVLQGKRLVRPTMTLVYRPDGQSSNLPPSTAKRAESELWQIVARPMSKSSVLVPSPIKKKRQKERSCTVCSVQFATKPALRTHRVTNHMNEILEGKIVCKVTPEELATALNISRERVQNVGDEIHAAWKPGGYIPGPLVQHIVRRIRSVVAREKDSEVGSNESLDSNNVINKIRSDKPGNVNVGRRSGSVSDYPIDIPSWFSLGPEVFQILRRMHFGDLRQIIDECLKGRQLRNNDQLLFTTDTQVLRQYTRILQSKLPPESRSKHIVNRILEDIAIYERRGPLLAASKVNWKLLPKGSYPFDKVLKHFEELSRRKKYQHQEYDVARLHRINSLSPDEIYVGNDEFEGYVVFYFAQIKTAVLDCPLTGNAIYVFGENWKTLSRLTKSALINRRASGFHRIVHNGEWFSRLKSLLVTGRVRASHRQP
jgi:hypothetical protein